jgi:hypothetical protein
VSEFCKENWGKLLFAVTLLLVIGWALYCVSFNTSVDTVKLNNFLVGIGAIGACFTGVAVAAAFAQVMEARKQLRDNRLWNKMSFALTYFQHDRFEEWERALEASINLISRDKPLSPEEVSKIFAQPETHLALKNFLNALESYCLAVNQGLADEETAKRKYRLKLTAHFAEMKPFIDRLRQIHRSDRVFCEIEDVHERWSKPPEAKVVKY